MTTTLSTTVTLPNSMKPPNSSTAHESATDLPSKASDTSPPTSTAVSTTWPAPSEPPKNHGLGDTYKLYSGDGSTAAGWPDKSLWPPFEKMWNNNKRTIETSCAVHQDWGSPGDPSPDEIRTLRDAIKATSTQTGVDARLILAIILQESKGCVRVPTTSVTISNPGLMQTYNGTASCNTGQLVNGVLQPGKVLTPCPPEDIWKMIQEGTEGISTEAMSLIYALNRHTHALDDDVSRIYRAARIYNSGEVDVSGDLGKGNLATNCYASDIANRLTGWVNAKSKCELGDK